MIPSLTHRELCEVAGKWLRNTERCGVVFVEMATAHGETPDAIGWKLAGQCSTLVECKTSRSDMLRDKKKYFRRNPELGLGVRRYVMVQDPAVCRPDDLETNWGLLVFDGKRVRRIVEAKPFPKSIMQLRGEITLLYSSCRREVITKDSGEPKPPAASLSKVPSGDSSD